MSDVNCPLCEGQMILRKSKYGSQFYGCSNYPKCKGTKPYVVERVVSDLPKKVFEPNKYQQVIFDRIISGSTNSMIVTACAGSGKTTTTERLSSLLPKNKRILYTVFNTKIRDDALRRMPINVTVLTTHQLGLQTITNSLGEKPVVDNDKTYKNVKALIGQRWELDRHLIAPVIKLVGLLKNTLSEPIPEQVFKLVNNYNVDIKEADLDRVLNLAIQVYHASNKQKSLIDYDDMLFYPNYFGMKPQGYDWVLTDEVQDFNEAQIKLVLSSLNGNGKSVAVGDGNQAIYGFRGASIDAMDRVKQRLNADDYPLSITYRVPLSGVDYVNKRFPHISFEGNSGKEDGIIDNIDMPTFHRIVKSGDMVLCRSNAPLVQPAFELIRQGKKVTIVGRDIGVGLVEFIEKFKENNIYEFFHKINNYQDKEIVKLAIAGKNMQIVNLQDKVDTIMALSVNCNSVEQLIKKINSVFSDTSQGILFSTVHKAKGLESDNVFILSPETIPHPMAKMAWEKQQEENLAYVAYTRHKKELHFIGEQNLLL